jgi:predicted aldo/keto reductase-like oxidoreductase
MPLSVNRRKFIGSSILGATAMLMSGKVKAAQTVPEKSKNFVCRTLGKTCLQLPVVNLGVMRVDNPRLVTAALDAGMIHLDTAHVYQGGRNEEMLGEILKDYDRKSFVLATKIKASNHDTTDKFIEKFEESLKRLQMDYVDILYLHASESREHTLDERWINAFKKLKEMGKIRFTGVTTHKNEPEVIYAAIESNFYDVVLTAYNYRMDYYNDVKKAIAEAAEAGLGIIGMKTMAGVYLDKDRTKKVNTKAALKWVLQDRNIHTTIPGCTSFDQLEDNLQVAKDIRLTKEEELDLEKSSKNLSMFCTGCSDCEDQCPYHLPVPDLMRAYMYAYGYKDLAMGKNVLDQLELKDDICQNCNECTVNCRSGFNVAEKAKDIIRLKQVPDDFFV